MNILPRQAQDKRRENSKKRNRFVEEWSLDRERRILPRYRTFQTHKGLGHLGLPVRGCGKNAVVGVIFVRTV